MRFFFAILFVLSVLMPSFGHRSVVKNIPPRKGDITKNIHVLFDTSGSMTVGNFVRGYKEIEMMATEGTDEFNLAVSVFAVGHLRMKVKDPDCKLKPNWMAMPSDDHAKEIVPWIKKTNLFNGGTYLLPLIKEIFKENKKDVTIIIISDCLIIDGVRALDYIKKQRENDKTHDIKVGFVNTDRYVQVNLYERIKKDGYWYVSIREEEK